MPHSVPARNQSTVALLDCLNYERSELLAAIDAAMAAIAPLPPLQGARVLVKPNLISARPAGGPACTHPRLVVAVAEWLLARGARVSVGDSPAFGSGESVMDAIGLTAALKRLPVQPADFRRGRSVVLDGGLRVTLARGALDCDFLFNLPKVKSHGQLFMTLGLKNLFGTVVGLQKPMLHMRYGRDCRFVGMIVDLLSALPPVLSLADGVVAMEGRGPLHGSPLELGLLAASSNPVALDTAILHTLGLAHEKSPLWNECRRRGLAGSAAQDIVYPRRRPEDWAGRKFQAPHRLDSIVFRPDRALYGMVRRGFLAFREKLKKFPG